MTNAAGDSLLILAAYHDHPDVVLSLLTLGADTSKVNDRGQTALGAAVFRSNLTATTALLDAGADPRRGARSALEIARFFDLIDMLKVLEVHETAAPSELCTTSSGEDGKERDSR